MNHTVPSPFRGQRPFGWEEDKIHPRPREADAVRAAASRLIRTEDTVWDVARTWNEAGLTTSTGRLWDGDRVKKYFARVRLAGLMQAREQPEPVSGPWEALLDRPTWEAVLARISRPGIRSRHHHSAVYLGTGWTRCGTCSNSMEGHQTAHQGRRYWCSSVRDPDRDRDERRHPQITASVLDDRIRSGVLAVLHRHGTRLIEQPTTIEAANMRIGALHAAKQQLLRLASDRLNGLTRASTDQRLRALDAEIDVAEAERDDAVLQTTLDLLDGTDLDSLSGSWDRLALGDQRTIATRVVSVEVRTGREIDRVHVADLLA